MTTKLFMALTTAAILLLPILALSDAGQKIPCRYGCVDCCGKLGCVPQDTSMNRDKVRARQRAGDTSVKTFCGKCLRDADCGGTKCGRDGLCASDTPAPAPRQVWPNFHLLTTEIAFAKDTDSFTGFMLHPIIGAGYLFEGAFCRVTLLRRTDGSYVAADVPHWYWNAGGALAFSTGSQNVFGQAGLSYYYPAIFISSYSLLGLYQRNGAALWKNACSDRAGAAVSLAIMQNVYVKGGYLWPLSGSGKAGAYFSIAYMKDLLGDLAPDRYRKFLSK